MEFTTTNVFGPVSEYKEYITVIGRVSGADTVTIEREIDTDDWEVVFTIADGTEKSVRTYLQGGRFRVTPSGTASYTLRGMN
jgi:hypothetical protein